MKKNVLALSIAAAVVGFAGSAHAITAPDVGGTASDLRFGNTGTGHMLLVPYFSTQDGNSTLLSLINTDTVNGKAVKVRFRGAANSDDVFDFQVFLSPGDVWTANVSKNEQGLSYLTTHDASCTKPAKATLNSTPFVTTRLNPAASAEDKANQTREGYIEIFNMADIPPSTTGGLYPLIKHKDGVAPCANTPATATAAANNAWTAINTNTDYATLTGGAIGMARPTTGLAANWTIINVPKAVAWSGAAAAIEAVAGAALGTGNLVYFPQTSGNVSPTDAALFTADPLMQGASPLVQPALYDLPDMSTPYVTASANPSFQALALAEAIETTSVQNEFWTDPAISAATDWVFSMPTRRYAVAVNYKAANPTNPAGADVPAPVFSANNTGVHFAAANTKMVGDKLCIRGITPMPWDREERQPAAPDDVVISPSQPGEAVLFCGEASVLSFNNGGATSSGVLSANVALKDIDVPYIDGWMRLATPGAAPGRGLPVLGQAFVGAYNPSVSEGVSGNFNTGWEHRYVRTTVTPQP